MSWKKSKIRSLDLNRKNSSALPEHLALRINQRERAIQAAENIELSIKNAGISKKYS